jgi:hypothetical protein
VCGRFPPPTSRWSSIIRQKAAETVTDPIADGRCPRGVAGNAHHGAGIALCASIFGTTRIDPGTVQTHRCEGCRSLRKDAGPGPPGFLLSRTGLLVQLLLPKGAYRRANGNLPPFELVNMLAEQTASAQGGVSLSVTSRSCVFGNTRGSGPINGVYRREDLFGGAVFSVSGIRPLPRRDFTRNIDGAGPVSWASSDLELVVTRGTIGMVLQRNRSSSDRLSRWRECHRRNLSRRAVHFRSGGQSHKYYWSAVLNARTVNALSFASAESAPDYLRDVLAIGDRLALAGGGFVSSSTIPTGNANLPFQRINQADDCDGRGFDGDFGRAGQHLPFRRLGSRRLSHGRHSAADLASRHR